MLRCSSALSYKGHNICMIKCFYAIVSRILFARAIFIAPPLKPQCDVRAEEVHNETDKKRGCDFVKSKPSKKEGAQLNVTCRGLNDVYSHIMWCGEAKAFVAMPS